ncbi:hypothetical protein [Kaistia sp. MMO-174]|uniref:hypothetical protein n=1 Tax=Kaistia sp. MMO-174 TaxID=3081256 RepID=UPI003018E7F8
MSKKAFEKIRIGLEEALAYARGEDVGVRMTGFFVTLTPEQKAAALAYRGPENFGGPHRRPARGLRPQRRKRRADGPAGGLHKEPGHLSIYDEVISREL